MELKLNRNTLVIIGLWNTGIFNQNWIRKYLFPKNEFSIEFLVDNRYQVLTKDAIRIASNKIAITIIENKMSLVPIEPNNENFEIIQELSTKIADYLIHTPVSAFGINFVFKEQINNSLQSFFDLKSFAKLKELGILIKANHLAHEFEYKEKKVKLQLSSNGEACEFSFNFHFEIKDLVEFKDIIDANPIIDLKKDALCMMSEVFGLSYGE